MSLEERCNPKKIVLRVEVGKYEKSVLLAQGTVCEMHRGDRKSITLREPSVALCGFTICTRISQTGLWVTFSF